MTETVPPPGGCDALAGVTVLEFGSYAAGPAIGRHLANFGAFVVHVESTHRPDGFRLEYPPFKDGRAGLNRGGCFTIFNDSKMGVTIDLKHPDAAGLVHRMAARADIVIENMRPGVLQRLGLGYDALSAINPAIVLLSTNNMGQTGPNAHHPGFGSQLSSLSGFTELIGREDGPPGFVYGPYIDLIAVAYGGAAVLAALDHARRTGQGAHIDLAQYEAGLQFIAPALLQYDADGVVAHREANRDPGAVPHNAYPCADGRFCAISCWDDEEWRRFCLAASGTVGPASDSVGPASLPDMSLPGISPPGMMDWTADPRFATAASRRLHEKELDAAIAGWTHAQDAVDLMTRLQRHGVHAGVVNTMADLFADPQLDARGTWQMHVHPEIGPHRYRMTSYQLSATPGRTRHAAPCLGQHNDDVFRGWLGLSEAEYEGLASRGVFD